MARYPRRQSNVTAQVESLISGFTNQPEDFPHADVPSLQEAYNEFMQASAQFLSIQSQAGLAAERKLEKFTKLSNAMKKQIKLAQADCSDDPLKLSAINWGPKSQPSPIEPPSPPGNLRIIAQEGSTVHLTWDKPAAKSSGGPVRIYLIERHIYNDSAYNWELAGTSYNPEVTLKSQPTGLKLDYQVRASNAAGQSCSTNMISVVL